MAKIRPVARTEGLLTEDLTDEVLVYDSETDVAFSLNRSAALVWRSCDGERSPRDLVRVLEKDLGGVADEDMVLVALDSLVEHGLIASGYERRAPAIARINRRRFIARVGVAAAAVPVVASMAVPVPAAAASGGYAPYYGTATSDRRLKRNIRTLAGPRQAA